MAEIKWTELPPSTRGKAKTGRSTAIDEVVKELRANPGRWALVAENVYPTARATWVKRGLEVRGRMVGGGVQRQNLYARYNPNAA